MRDLGILLLRLTLGGFLAGHGAQKLFGTFEGPGLHGAGQWMESMGLQPGERWAATAGLGEFGGGVLTALGFLHPVGPITTVAPMVVAWGRTHWGKPIWVTSGGAELDGAEPAAASFGHRRADGANRRNVTRPCGTPFAAAGAVQIPQTANSRRSRRQPHPGRRQPYPV